MSRRYGVLLVAMLSAGHAWSQSDVGNSFQTLSDFGGVGILQMPSARFGPEGELSLSSSRANPYSRTGLTFQFLPGLEGVLRYTSITNRAYGASSFSGSQVYKDRGFDIKLKLLEESEWLPQVALGFRDVGGTGLFSGEYLAASRRYFDLDFTLGLAWGNMGSRGNVVNPFTWVSDRFKSRANNVGQGGNLSNQYFGGERASLFGGMIWHTPIKNVLLKAELDGNNYRSEPLDNRQPASSPFNIGVVYRYSDGIDFALAYERGNTFMAQLVLKGNLQTLQDFYKFDPAPNTVRARTPLSADVAVLGGDTSSRHQSAGEGVSISGSGGIKRKSPMVAKRKLSGAIKKKLADQGIRLKAGEVQGSKALLVLEQDRYRSSAKYIGRAVRAVADELPDDVEELSLKNLESGLETYSVNLLRKDFENALQFQGSPEEIAVNTRFAGPNGTSAESEVMSETDYPNVKWGWSPGMKHHIGGPDNPWFYQLMLTAGAEWRFSQRWSLTSDVGINVINNFDALQLNSDSKLPHVRSDIKDYLKQGKNSISRFQMDYLGNLGENTYYRYSGGIFEDMFAGVGMEYLYRPYGERWALGMDLNRVRQRDYNQLFDLRAYQVTTGHVDWYYQFPVHNLKLQVSAGRYLAGDRGVTVDLSRRFLSGAVVGAFATVTNVSAAQFGEGSFDKGIYIKVPLDLLSLFSSRTMLGMTWRPLTRDGGQRLVVGKRLFPLVENQGPESMYRDWGRVLD